MICWDRAGESVSDLDGEPLYGTQRSMVDGGCNDFAAAVAVQDGDAPDLHAAEGGCSPLQIRRRGTVGLRGELQGFIDGARGGQDLCDLLFARDRLDKGGGVQNDLVGEFVREGGLRLLRETLTPSAGRRGVRD